MADEYILVVRNQDNRIFGAVSHNQASYVGELSVLHGYLLNNLKSGAVCAEVHRLLTGETLPQAMERIEQSHLKPLARVTEEDFSAEEIKEYK